MPLLKGKENIGHNIEVEQRAGKPHKQAIAIALREAGVPKKDDCDQRRYMDAVVRGDAETMKDCFKKR